METKHINYKALATLLAFVLLLTFISLVLSAVIVVMILNLVHLSAQLIYFLNLFLLIVITLLLATPFSKQIRGYLNEI